MILILKKQSDPGLQYCKFGKFCESFIFAKFFLETNSRNCEMTMSFTDVGKSYPCHEFLTWQISLLTLFAKIKLLQKFPNLQ